MAFNYFLLKSRSGWYVRYGPFNGWKMVAKEYATPWMSKEDALNIRDGILIHADGMLNHEYEVVEIKVETIKPETKPGKKYKYAIKYGNNLYVQEYNFGFVEKNKRTLYDDKDHAEDIRALFCAEYSLYTLNELKIVKVPAK